MAVLRTTDGAISSEARARHGRSGLGARSPRGRGSGSREPELATFIYSTILHHDTLEAAVVHRLSERLDHAACRAS